MTPPRPAPSGRAKWLNSTVLGIGLASLFSDWSHEIATALLPTFLATLGVAAAWLGLIEGVSDGLSSLGKLASGHFTDRLRQRKPIMVIGYAVTAFATASFGLATTAWQVLLCRATAWLGRGVRTPVRKALLAAAVTPDTYGRAFGFERMMDTCGAIIGPTTALGLLAILGTQYHKLFALTLIPGLTACACLAFLVRERERKKVSAITFREGLRRLPPAYRKFLAAVFLFGLGDFAHSLLILFATQKLAPTLGFAAASRWAVGLYVLHNIFYAGFSYGVGILADRWNKRRLLAGGYSLAAVMVFLIMVLPATPWLLVIVFILGGIYVAMEETLEDAYCAELTTPEQHGMAFGVLATINGVGDFASSLVVGALWTWAGTTVAFGYSMVLFLAGALLVLRLGNREST